MGHLGVVRGFFVIAGFVMLGGLAMVLGCFLVVVRSLLVVLMDFMAIHWFSPWQQSRCKLQSPCKSNITGFDVTIATARLRQIIRAMTQSEFLLATRSAWRTAALAGKKPRRLALSASAAAMAIGRHLA